MNIARSFVDYMIAQGFGTVFGTDIFIGGIPQDAPDTAWWVVSAGGSPGTKNQTAELQKNYVLNIYYRSTDAESVYNEIQSLEIELNKPTCITLAGFDTIEIEATTFPTDQDLESEERTVGLLTATVKTYYKE